MVIEKQGRNELSPIINISCVEDTLFHILVEKNLKFGECYGQIDDYLYHKLLGDITFSESKGKYQINSEIQSPKTKALFNETNEETEQVKCVKNNLFPSDVIPDKFVASERLDTFQVEAVEPFNKTINNSEYISKCVPNILNQFRILDDYVISKNDKLEGKGAIRQPLNPLSCTEIIETESVDLFGEFGEYDKPNHKLVRGTRDMIISTDGKIVDKGIEMVKKNVTRYIHEQNELLDTSIATGVDRKIKLETRNSRGPMVNRNICHSNIKSPIRVDTCFDEGYQMVYLAANAEMAFSDMTQLAKILEHGEYNSKMAKWAFSKAYIHHSEVVESLKKWYLAENSRADYSKIDQFLYRKRDVDDDIKGSNV